MRNFHWLKNNLPCSGNTTPTVAKIRSHVLLRDETWLCNLHRTYGIVTSSNVNSVFYFRLNFWIWWPRLCALFLTHPDGWRDNTLKQDATISYQILTCLKSTKIFQSHSTLQKQSRWIIVTKWTKNHSVSSFHITSSYAMWRFWPRGGGLRISFFSSLTLFPCVKRSYVIHFQGSRRTGGIIVCHNDAGNTYFANVRYWRPSDTRSIPEEGNPQRISTLL